MKQLYVPKKEPMRIAAFMSRTGSNLKRILESQSDSYKVVMIFADTGDENKCSAKKIAAEYNVPAYCNDINEFYDQKGKDRKDLKAREEYDRETLKLIEKHEVDVIVLGGYMSILTGVICDKYLTLNIHPADLRILNSKGKRMYAGCMAEECVKKVIENKGKKTASSIHIATGGVDEGPIITVSDQVQIKEDVGATFEEVKKRGLEMYPKVLKLLSQGRYWMDEKENFVIDLVEEKELLREKMKELREKMSDDDVKSKSGNIIQRLSELNEFNTAKTIMFYMGVNKEVQTEGAVRIALENGKRVVVPVSDLDKGEIIPALIESINNLKPGAFGILEPNEVTKVDRKEIDLVIVPGLAFDDKGRRIGYGLGYYDKFLENFKGEKIALAYELQIVDKVRTTTNDVGVDKILTEERVIEVRK